VQLTALSQNPAETRAKHGIDAEFRMDMEAVRSVLTRSDLLISGGGSLLQDTTSLRSLIYYLWVARLALQQSVPVMFYAQGMGPFHRRISRWLVRLIGNKVSYITVRDSASAQLLRSIGVTVPPVEVTADPAFALSPAPQAEIDACRGFDLAGDGRPRIGVALRPWGANAAAQIEEYADLLRALEDGTGARVVLIPMQQPGDAEFSQAVARKCGRSFQVVSNACSPAALLGVVGEMDAIVAMRLHALIFAARMAVPPYALSYDPKVDALMQRLDVTDSISPWTGFSAAACAQSVKTSLADRPERSAKLRECGAALEQLALRNAEIAMSLTMDN
jgi:polysaccharide pyruvyl transferase CsaB